MSNSLSAPGLCCAISLHAIALGALLLAGSDETPVTASDADPILLMLGGEDPNKDAGLVGRERGVARGTQDGENFDPTADTSQLDAIRQKNEQLAREEAEAAKRAAEQARKEAERRAAEKAAAEEKARQEAQQRARANQNSTKPKPPAPPKPAGAGNPTPERVDIRSLVNSNRNKIKSGNSGNRNGRSNVRIGEIKVGGGSVLGSPDGTGGNGGDGGKRVADARRTYVAAVRERFVIHFQNVVDQNPPSIPQLVSVNARFSVGKNGEIKFLEIEGSSNPQIRECIRKAFSLAFPSRFQSPPNGEAFTGRLDGIEFSPN